MSNDKPDVLKENGQLRREAELLTNAHEQLRQHYGDLEVKMVSKCDALRTLTAERDNMLEECCEAVVAAGFATGPADNFQELLNHLLPDVARLQKEVERLKSANEAWHRRVQAVAPPEDQG